MDCQRKNVLESLDLLMSVEGEISLVPTLEDECRTLHIHWHKVSEAVHDHARDPRLLNGARHLLALVSEIKS